MAHQIIFSLCFLVSSVEALPLLPAAALLLTAGLLLPDCNGCGSNKLLKILICLSLSFNCFSAEILKVSSGDHSPHSLSGSLLEEYLGAAQLAAGAQASPLHPAPWVTETHARSEKVAASCGTLRLHPRARHTCEQI